MGRYITIYRWKPENAMAFVKKWLTFFPGYPGPQRLKEAAQKAKWVSMNYSLSNSCVFFVYDIADEDMIDMNICALYLMDVCTLETFPVMTPDDHAKSFDIFADTFPDIMAELTKE